jgi:hypothetical protein
MAAPFQTLGLIGVDLARVVTAVAITAGTETPQVAIGTIALASDGKTYVYAKANATIVTTTAVCTVSPTTFLATATGGAYTVPVAGMVTGDYGWFAKANV